MKLGSDVLLRERKDVLKGKSVGLVANLASCTSRLQNSFDVFRRNRDFDLRCVFGPEHGFRGDAQDMVDVGDYCIDDEITVYSLYGSDEESLSPKAYALKDLDVLVFDLQDVGSRYYTFVSTMAHCMEACRNYRRGMIVLDRPNPLGGLKVEGNVVDPEFSSIVSKYPLAVRHGMTIGELALMINEHFGIGCDLTVVPCQGWRRDMWFDKTRLYWIPPSPNMPFLDTAVVYPGTCLLEGTNISEGRGTTRPFELVGASWIQPDVLVKRLNSEKRLKGVSFLPTYFTPTFHKYCGHVCGGVHIAVKNRQVFDPFLTGIAMIKAVRHLYPDHFQWRSEPYEFVHDRLAFDLLAGGKRLRKMIEQDAPLEEIEKSWQPQLRAFAELREHYLLY